MNYILSNRHFIIIVTLLLVTWGVISFRTIPRSEDPQVEFTGSSVFVLLPGAGPEDVEKLVVDPIEEELNKLNDINHLTSSSAENVALLNIEFTVNTDPDDKYREVQTAIDNIRNRLPAGIARLEITKYSSSDVSILQYALIAPSLPYHRIVDSAEKLKKRLQRISGVEKVAIQAYPDRQVNVEILPEKIEAAGISLEQVAAALKGANMAIPAGSLIADERRFSIRVNSEFRSVDDVGNTIVGAYGSQSIRLCDIAAVSLTDGDTLYHARFNGQRTVFLTLSQKKGTNIFPLTKAIHKEIRTFLNTGEPVVIETVFDQSRSVDRRLNGFFVNLLQGIFLVGSVTVLTLGTSSAAIIIFVILLSILTAIGVLDASGFGLDQISIVALAIALGMLVDNAIVVVELVARKKGEGTTGDEAAVASIGEIGGAIVSSTLTTVVAFLPLAFLHSYVGQFIRGLPLTVIFTLTASLLFALTITPLAAGRFTPRPEKLDRLRIRRFLYIISENHYRRILETILRRPKTVLVVAAVLFACSLTLFPGVKVSLFPSAEKPQVFITIETPKGSALSRVDSTARAIERILEQHSEVLHYATNLGKGNPRIYYNMFPAWESPNIGQILVTLSTGREAEVGRIVAQLRTACSTIPAAKIHIQELQQGMPVAAPVAIRVIGDNLDSIMSFSKEVETIIARTKGTVNIRNPVRESRTDVRVNVNRDKASLAGIAPAQVAAALRSAVLGTETTTLRNGNGDEFPVILHTGTARAPFMEELERVSIPSVTGDKVPLRQIAAIAFEQGPSIINHYRLERVTTVLADVENGYNTARITGIIKNQLENLPLPRNIKWKVAGEEESRDESFGGITKALAAALIAIFALLVLQFGNFSQPFIVFTAIPFAISGSIVALLVTGYSFSFTAFIGFTSLMGIVVNNSIILVDCANRFRKGGMELFDTAVNACTQRFVPIVLTTVTTLLGLFPLILTGSSLWAPLAWVITGGLIVSTVLTLFVVPALYLLYTRK
jgi:multidrug efflux pump subunit AcrB